MLEIKDIYKTFNPGTINEVRSLQGITLSIEEGEFVTVIGTNGSGKSTLLNAIAGGFTVDQGSIWIDGNDVTHWQEYKRAKFIGRVFQNPFSGTAPNLSIAENLSLAAYRGLPRGFGRVLNKDLRNQIISTIKTLGMGLEDRLDNVIGSLSGGQRQALTLLMATWLKPKLLLLDEHTAALDPKSADQVIRITERIVSENRLTTFMVTHSMQQAVDLGNRLVMLHRGRVVHDFSGSEKNRLRPEDLMARFEEVRRADRLDQSVADLLKRRYV